MGDIFRNQRKENKMKISRRQFFTGLGGLIVASGISRFKTIDSAMAAEPKSIGRGKVDITWLGLALFSSPL